MTVDIIWRKIPLREVELSLAKVLRCGQTFRWKNVNNVWSFAIKDRIILLKQYEESIEYSHILKEDHEEDEKPRHVLEKETYTFIHDYFNLDINIENLYKSWIKYHEPFSKKSKISAFTEFTGIRIIRQDPWECLISFICSSNNNVKRISKMCDNLCSEFGDYINEYNGIKYYSFPSAHKLAQDSKTEQKLRDLGFGYRAKYIYDTAKKLTDDSKFPDLTIDKLNELRQLDYETSHDFLLQLTGVGPKVADCICLMALDKHDVVPVDTHVYQIAIRDYKFKGKKDLKTMNKVTYGAIGEFFKQLYGPYAGWAQSVLFASDLNDLKNGTNIVDTVEVKKEVKIENETSRKRIKLE
ncbi:DNA glycosylase [Scheffersomyces coipomensis]|uniref:DNA glycosylase n=1 Tax=Scheffersomyces coipomensis TaxID=1788519 RepID=UPI00315CF8D2